MAVLRMDHVGVIVDDLDAAIAFFAELGLEQQGRMALGGPPVDRITGLEGVRTDFAFMRTPDGHGQLELIRFESPASPAGDPDAPTNALGLRHLTFAVDDIESALAGLRSHGAELVGEVVDYEDTYRLCYVRGPAGIIVELAEKLS
jgi:catechol 2,3-dioxygenase-like lactoylglutathione lyase family enzyme